MNRNEIKDFIALFIDTFEEVNGWDLSVHEFMSHGEGGYGLEKCGLETELVHSVGGYEGGGEDVVRVIHLVDKKNNKEAYIQYEGWYASYHGTEFECGINDFTIVEPKEVVVTQYFGVSE